MAKFVLREPEKGCLKARLLGRSGWAFRYSGAAPGAELAPAACLKFSLGPLSQLGSDSDLKARRWSTAGSGMWRTAPVFEEAALWSIREEADGATLAVTAAWFASILNEWPS